MQEENRPVEFEFAMGVRVKDITCNFQGIVTARLQHLNGCLQYTVQPMPKTDGERQDAWNIDENQLVRVDRGINDKAKKAVEIVATPEPKEATGGPSTRAPSNRVSR